MILAWKWKCQLRSVDKSCRTLFFSIMQIHIGRNGQALGIFGEDEVRIGLANGTFLGTDLAWRDGMGEWQPLSSFSSFNAPPVLQQDASALPATTPILMSATPPKSGLALASMICGIAAIPGCFCCVALPLSLAAIICGHLALADIAKKPHLEGSRNMAKAGLIIGYIMIAMSIAGFFLNIGMAGLSAVTDGLNR